MQRQTLTALLAGLIFGIGLAVSQMANPAKVIGFLDIGSIFDGGWDPSLAFVMGGALLVTIPGYRWLRRREKPFAAASFSWPQKTEIDRHLVIGAALFGLGWGLVGLCPGPALAAVGLGSGTAMVFLLAMLAGMALHRFTSRP